MKKLLMAAVAASALSATPALAQTSANYAVTGTVAAACGSLTDGSISFGSGIATDAATGNLTSGQSASTTASSYCNGVNSKIKVETTDALHTTNTTTDAAFTSTLTMAPSVTYGSSTFLASGGEQTIGAFSGTLTVSTGVLTASAKPVAGDYTGTIKVTLTPAS